MTMFDDQNKAEEIASTMNEGEDEGWLYATIQKGDLFTIAVYDEEHEFLGYL